MLNAVLRSFNKGLFSANNEINGLTGWEMRSPALDHQFSFVLRYLVRMLHSTALPGCLAPSLVLHQHISSDKSPKTGLSAALCLM